MSILLAFQETDNKEVVQLLESLDGRKPTSEDRILVKCVPLAANEPTNTLTLASTFPICNS